MYKLVINAVDEKWTFNSGKGVSDPPYPHPLAKGLIE